MTHPPPERQKHPQRQVDLQGMHARCRSLRVFQMTVGQAMPVGWAVPQRLTILTPMIRGRVRATPAQMAQAAATPTPMARVTTTATTTPTKTMLIGTAVTLTLRWATMTLGTIHDMVMVMLRLQHLTLRGATMTLGTLHNMVMAMLTRTSQRRHAGHPSTRQSSLPRDQAGIQWNTMGVT